MRARTDGRPNVQPGVPPGRRSESILALTVAEALSCVVRGLDEDEAVATVRSAAGDCADVLSTASSRCLDHEHVDATIVQQAVDLLATAAMHARQAAGSDRLRSRRQRVTGSRHLLPAATDPLRGRPAT